MANIVAPNCAALKQKLQAKEQELVKLKPITAFYNKQAADAAKKAKQFQDKLDAIFAEFHSLQVEFAAKCPGMKSCRLRRKRK